MWTDICGDLAAIFHKGDNFCDFLFVLLYTNPLLKRGLLYKDRICSLWLSGSKFFAYIVDPFSERDKNNFERVTSPWKCIYSFKECINHNDSQQSVWFACKKL